MKGNIIVHMSDTSLAERIKQGLETYSVKFDSPQLAPELGVIITDSTDFLDREDFRKNIEVPVLYISKDSTNLARIISEKNIFRAGVLKPDLDNILIVPAKEKSEEIVPLAKIVDYLADARILIQKFALLVESEQFGQRMSDEIMFTRKGDYGLPYQPQEKLRQTRGLPREISRIEAAYQAIHVFAAFENRQQKEGPHKSILFVSSEPERIMKYANFLKMMAAPSIVEIASQVNQEVMEEISNEKYSLIIYDGARLNTRLDANELDTLIDKAWSKHVEVLAMCNTKKLFRLMSDSQIRYKLHHGLTDSAGYREFLETVTHLLELHTLRKINKQMDTPDVWLVSNAIQNLFKSDPESIERGKNQLKSALELKTGLTLNDLQDLDVRATDELFTTFPLKFPDIGYLIKFLKDDRRAKVESIATQEFQSLNKLRYDNLEKFKKGELTRREELYWTNIPKINTRLKAMVYGKILIASYIKGPLLENIASELGERIQGGDKQALEFRNLTLFEMNKYCAFMQIKGIKIPEVTIEQTNFQKDFSNIVNNIKSLTCISAAEHQCADICGEIFAINIADPNSTQYFDFYWDNILFETGNDSDTYEDILNNIKTQGVSSKQFIEDKITRIDFNKIYRYTSFTEDPSRFAAKNFMRSPRNKRSRDDIEQDRTYFYTHLLLYRKKFLLLEHLMATEGTYDKLAPKIGELCTLIDRWENKYDKLTDSEKDKIKDYVSEEKRSFFSAERYVATYRIARHSNLLFTDMRDHKNKLETGRIPREQYDASMKLIERDFRETYGQTTYILKKIIQENKKCLQKKSADINKYSKLFSDANNDLTEEHANEFKEQLKLCKKISDPDEQKAWFNYISTNYLFAYFRKISKEVYKI